MTHLLDLGYWDFDKWENCGPTVKKTDLITRIQESVSEMVERTQHGLAIEEPLLQMFRQLASSEGALNYMINSNLPNWMEHTVIFRSLLESLESASRNFNNPPELSAVPSALLLELWPRLCWAELFSFEMVHTLKRDEHLFAKIDENLLHYTQQSKYSAELGDTIYNWEEYKRRYAARKELGTATHKQTLGLHGDIDLAPNIYDPKVEGNGPYKHVSLQEIGQGSVSDTLAIAEHLFSKTVDCLLVTRLRPERALRYVEAFILWLPDCLKRVPESAQYQIPEIIKAGIAPLLEPLQKDLPVILQDEEMCQKLSHAIGRLRETIAALPTIPRPKEILAEPIKAVEH